MYKLLVSYGDGDKGAIVAWENFLNDLMDRQPNNILSVETIEEVLKKYNCVNIYYSDYIKFETKDDAVDFLLRWL